MYLSKFVKYTIVCVLSTPVILISSTVSVYAYNYHSTKGPVDIIGGPLMVFSKGVGDVRWILPGQRRLDPKVFGTPQAPLGFEAGIGLPISQRLMNAEGTAWTTTRGPTPFSDNYASVSGNYYYKVIDSTLDDSPLSRDKISFKASFTSPDNNISYTVTANRIIPVGPDHSFLGGVATNFYFHGKTGIGTKLMPTMPAQVSFWGVGTFEVNGTVIATNRVVHLMTSCNTRDTDYKLVFDDAVDCSRTHTHVMLPNIEITPNGPVTSPLPTGYILPNGVEQPFIHTMYENIWTSAIKYR